MVQQQIVLPIRSHWFVSHWFVSHLFVKPLVRQATCSLSQSNNTCMAVFTATQVSAAPEVYPQRVTVRGPCTIPMGQTMMVIPATNHNVPPVHQTIRRRVAHDMKRYGIKRCGQSKLVRLNPCGQKRIVGVAMKKETILDRLRTPLKIRSARSAQLTLPLGSPAPTTTKPASIRHLHFH